MEYIAQTIEHIVLKVEPWELIDLQPNWHLATIHPFDVYTDREEAIAAIRAQYPDFEPSPWESPPVPESITPRKARLALLEIGLLDQVTVAVQALPEPDRSKVLLEWEYALEIRRDDPWVISLGAALGLTEKDLDKLFIHAEKL